MPVQKVSFTCGSLSKEVVFRVKIYPECTGDDIDNGVECGCMDPNAKSSYNENAEAQIYFDNWIQCGYTSCAEIPVSGCITQDSEVLKFQPFTSQFTPNDCVSESDAETRSAYGSTRCFQENGRTISLNHNPSDGTLAYESYNADIEFDS